MLLEGGEKSGPIDPIEDRSRPVENFGQLKAGERSGIAGLMKQFGQDRNAQILARMKPVEPRLAVGRGMVTRPEHPRGKNPVEKGLDQRRTKEVFASLALELDSERFFERLPDRQKSRHLAFLLDAAQGLARVRSHEPRDVLGCAQRRGVKHHALEKFDEGLALLDCERSRMTRRGPKGRLVGREAIVFELDRLSLRISTHEQKVTEICNEHLAVCLPVLRYLGALRGQEGVVTGWLCLYDAAGRLRAWQGLFHGGLLELIGREQADVRDTSAMAWIEYASDLGLQGCADGIQQRGERRIVGGFRDGRTGTTDVTEFE